MPRFEAKFALVKEEFPGFRILERDKSFLGPVFWALSKLSGTSYDSYCTTIGQTMYVGKMWASTSDDAKYRSISHEVVHTRQFHRWPLGPSFWVLNHILFTICYLLILPCFLTFRARFEREAYTETLRVDAELNGGVISAEKMERNARWLAEVFGGPAYFYMSTKKKTYAWAMETQRQINSGELAA